MVLLVLRPSVGAVLRNASLGGNNVKSKNFGELFDTKWPDGNRDALKEKTSVLSVVLFDAIQYAFVGLIQSLR